MKKFDELFNKIIKEDIHRDQSLYTLGDKFENKKLADEIWKNIDTIDEYIEYKDNAEEVLKNYSEYLEDPEKFEIFKDLIAEQINILLKSNDKYELTNQLIAYLLIYKALDNMILN